MTEKEMRNFERVYEAWIDSFSGASGGVIASLIFYPIENLRTRVQAADKGSKKSILDFFSKLMKDEGFLALYKGLNSALVGTVFSYGIYFWWYRFLKNLFARRLKRDKFSNVEMTVITAIAGTISSIFSNPIWFINTRLAV